ncbi:MULTISPECIES: hypothetical protein [Pseudomonas]|uniref:hypothetical protein n=1 Tax=Pseudomonas TaxID=286 RepID=UPI001CC2CECA|nr:MULTISPECIES: hypothetical protein [Pseudomonas]
MRSSTRRQFVSGSYAFPFPSQAFGVAQPLKTAAWFKVMFGVVKSCDGFLFESQAVGLGQPAART